MLAALKIIDRGDLSPDQMIGPFAGELGQFQFLPAHYFDYGVDYDGDGRRDLIRSTPDAVASAANYMSKIGWKRGQPWLEEVRVPAQMDWAQADLAIQHPRSQWARWGVTRADGSAIAGRRAAGIAAAADGPARAGVPRLSELPGLPRMEPVDRLFDLGRVSRDAHRGRAGDAARQQADRAVRLRADPRAADSCSRGAATTSARSTASSAQKSRAAVKAEQVKLGLPADSYPTPELVQRLQGR